MSSSSVTTSRANNPTTAQEEFASFLSKNSGASNSNVHPEDRRSHAREQAVRSHDDENEEDRFREAQIKQAMRLPTFDRLTMTATAPPVGGGPGVGVPVDGAAIKLPPASFDSGRATGVKGVIADARSYEMARRGRWMSRVRAARQSVFGTDPNKAHANHNGNMSGNNNHLSASRSDSDDDSDSALNDEEAFIREWRESRRRELEAESAGPMIRTRRTSPSVRIFGRLDTVDAMGYLDAIEKVGRETVVVVFVYDHECQVSAAIESAMSPLIGTYPTIHFVKVHYEDIEFDNAAVPAILAYRNQGDLFANLTGIIEMIPEDEDFNSEALKRLFHKHSIL